MGSSASRRKQTVDIPTPEECKRLEEIASQTHITRCEKRVSRRIELLKNSIKTEMEMGNKSVYIDDPRKWACEVIEIELFEKALNQLVEDMRRVGYIVVREHIGKLSWKIPSGRDTTAKELLAAEEKRVASSGQEQPPVYTESL